METAFTQYFDHLIRQFRDAFDQTVVVDRDEKPSRARLELTGTYNQYQVHFLEILLPSSERKYAYYVLLGDEVIVGFDNAPDPRALRLKYGDDYTHYRLSRVPHCHTDNKATISLTEELHFEEFLSWIHNNLPER